MNDREARRVLHALLNLKAGEFEQLLHDRVWTKLVARRLLKYELDPASATGLTKEEICQLRDFYHAFSSRLNAAPTQEPESNPIASHPASVRLDPPFNAEYLLILFLGKEERDVVIGDLIECYSRVVGQFGKRRADIWFYKQVAGSLWPLLRRAIVKLGVLVSLGKVLRRLIS